MIPIVFIFKELVDLVQGMKAQYDMQINVSLSVVQKELFYVEVFDFHSGLTFPERKLDITDVGILLNRL